MPIVAADHAWEIVPGIAAEIPERNGEPQKVRLHTTPQNVRRAPQRAGTVCNGIRYHAGHRAPQNAAQSAAGHIGTAAAGLRETVKSSCDNK